ncbi:MAG: hypothetical protein ACLRRT_12545 [Ruthenibacterium lactatiformans]
MENFWNDLNKLLSDFYKVTVYKGRWVQYLEGWDPWRWRWRA